METEITDIGKVAITPRKDYKNEQAYEWLDVVTYDGSSYMCIAEDGCTEIVPTNTGYWQLLADKGHFTEEDKEEFKKAVVEESKTEINEHTDNKKTELNNYTTELEKSLENELDTYKTEKETQMDSHKATLETEMANKKDSLIEEIETAQNGFDTNAEEKTNTFNSNVETKTTEFNNNSNAKTEEFNNNSAEKINAFNSNAEEKIVEYDAHAESVLTETEDLFNALNTEKASGTELYIEDAKPCRVINTEIGGMYKQNQTKGLNFFDITGYTDRTVNGINIKVNDDGTLTLNGVCTVEKTFVNISIPEHIIPAGTYTRYMSYAENIKSFLTLALSYNNTTIPNTSVQPNNQYTTSTYNDDITYNQIKLYIPNTNVTFNNIIVDPMLVRGEYTANNAPKYEPYTGGNPSPNPDYPQEIMQVEEVKTYVTGKNCYNISNFTANTTIGSFRGHWIYLKPNTKYTISTNMVTNPDGSLSPIIGEPKLSVAYIVVTTNTETNTLDSSTNGVAISNAKSRTVLTGGTGALFVGYRAGQNSIPTMVTKGGYIQIEEGTVATEYEPYQNQTVAIDLKGNKLCAISDTIKDKLLIDKNGNVALQKNVNYSTFTAFTTVNGSFSESTQFILALSNCVKNVEQNSFNALSNCMLKIITNGGIGYYGTTSSGSVRVTVLNSLLNVTQEDTTSTKLNAAKTFLQNLQQTPEIYYPAEVPELIDLGQLPELPKTFNGINNIWAETNLGNTEIEIEYVQDVKKLLEKQAEQQNARLDNIETLLSTTETSALLLDNMQSDLEKEVE